MTLADEDKTLVTIETGLDFDDFICWIANEYRDGVYQDLSEADLAAGLHYITAEIDFFNQPRHFIDAYKGA